MAVAVANATGRAQRHTTNQRASRLFALGLVGIAAYNAWKWRDDRKLAERLRIELARPCPALTATPKVSILVAAWNEAELIERHIQSVLALRYPDKEYILCAGGLDGTFEIARRHAGPGVTLLEQLPSEGKQRSLQKAFGYSTGEIIYLTDADCLMDDESFERTIEPIVNGREVATSGGSIPLPELLDDHPFVVYQWAVQVYAAARAAANHDALLGRNAAVQRRVLDQIGAFREAVPSGTDYLLGRQLRGAGYAIRHVPHSLVRTDYPASFGAYARQQRRWLRNVVLLGWRSRSWHEVRASVQTSLLGTGMLLGPLAGWALGGGVLALWGAALLHSAGAKVRYIAFASRIGPATSRASREHLGTSTASAEGLPSWVSTSSTSPLAPVGRPPRPWP
jgi:hypothetical protein